MRELIYAAAMRVAAAGAVEPAIPVVVVTGLVLVFLILVLLTFVLKGEGRFFAWLETRRGGQKKAVPAAGKPALPKAAVPVVQPGISPEVVAAIAAAVGQLEEGRYVLQSVRRQEGQGTRGLWGTAGIFAATEPF